MKGCRQPGAAGGAAESPDASRAPATAPRLTTTSVCQDCGESLSAYGTLPRGSSVTSGTCGPTRTDAGPTAGLGHPRWSLGTCGHTWARRPDSRLGAGSPPRGGSLGPDHALAAVGTAATQQGLTAHDSDGGCHRGILQLRASPERTPGRPFDVTARRICSIALVTIRRLASPISAPNASAQAVC